jgi:endonuclease/exonuclease/phosphatase family metal-dependent hydrolase
MTVPQDTKLIAKERRKLMKLMDKGGFAVPSRQVDVNLIIATWNIQNFSEKKTWRTLKYMADIIERFDIVAVQEIKTDLRGLAKLQEILPGKYRVLVSDVTGNNERFAFIYDERTVEATGLASDIALDVRSADHEGFQLHRMPYCASFKAGRFDFTLVSVHIFDSKASFKEREIDVLAGRIDKMSKTPKAKVVDQDLFVVGDFNIKKDGDRFFNALVKHGFQMPPILKTLKTNLLRTGTYDKIVWAAKAADIKFAGRCNIVPFNQVLYQDARPKGGKRQISDHLPLWAEFEINILTQHLEQLLNR